MKKTMLKDNKYYYKYYYYNYNYNWPAGAAECICSSPAWL